MLGPALWPEESLSWRGCREGSGGARSLYSYHLNQALTLWPSRHLCSPNECTPAWSGSSPWAAPMAQGALGSRLRTADLLAPEQSRTAAAWARQLRLVLASSNSGASQKPLGSAIGKA